MNRDLAAAKAREAGLSEEQKAKNKAVIEAMRRRV